LMGIFLAIMFGYSEARAEKNTVNLVMYSDTLEAKTMEAALAVRLSRDYGIRVSEDSPCIVHIIDLKADMIISCGEAKRSVSIMFVSGIFMKCQLNQDTIVTTFKGSFYWDKEHTERGFDKLAKVVSDGIAEVYSEME
jgi:hypothetical protein